MDKLTHELAAAVNRHSAENGSNTPDFILAEYLGGCLAALDRAVNAREKWYGRDEAARREAEQKPCRWCAKLAGCTGACGDREGLGSAADEIGSAIFPTQAEAQAPKPAMQCAKCGPQGCDGACLDKAPQTDAGDTPKTCDGKEQEAFEAWAKSQNMNMEEHPLHYLFLDQRTGGARDGWRAALAYCRPFFEAQAREIVLAKDNARIAWKKHDALKARVADMEREIACVRPKADCYDLVRARLGIENNIIGHVEGINARVARLEAHLMKAAIDLHAQVDVANKYAKDARPKEAREIPTVWEIQNSHFRDIARGIDTALAGDKANG